MNLGGYYYSEKELEEKGFKYLGKNVKIHSRASIYGTENISLGDHTRIDDYAVIVASGPVDIGAYVAIANFVHINGTCGIDIEDHVGISHGTQIYSCGDDYSGSTLCNSTIPPEFLTNLHKGKVHIGRHSIIGANSVLLCSSIQTGCAIGALSLVTKNTKAWGIYAGVPAKRIKERSKNCLATEKELYEKYGQPKKLKNFT